MSNKIVDIQRNFLPCQEWIYYKIYSGSKTLDLLLLQDIKPILERFLKKNLIKKFFFIRYRDTEEHIRLRLHLGSPDKIPRIMAQMNGLLSPLKEDRIIGRVLLDTYTREIERYGKYTIQLVEELFYIDSCFVLKCLTSNSPKNTWLYSISSSNAMFDLFEMKLTQKVEFCEKMFKSYSNEFNYSKRLKIALDSKYRSFSKEVVDHILSPPEDCEHLIKDYKADVFPVVYKIFGIYRLIGQDARFSLLSSLLHMHFNRMFKQQQRAQEFVIYYFLQKAYSSIKARKLR